LTHKPTTPHRGSGRAERPGRRRAAAAPFALLLAAALAVAGCSASGSSDSTAKDAAPAQAQSQGGGSAQDNGGSAPSVAPTPSGSTSGKGATTGRQTQPAATFLVRTANLTVRTAKVGNALDQARTMVTDAGGYAGDEDTSVDSGGHEQSTIQLRVPPAAYDGLLTRLAGLGTLLDRKVSVEDVTGQVVDVQSRIKSQQASVARVRKLMDQAGTLGDVVSLESELSTREADLEALQAQQSSLRERTNLATVTLRLVEPPVRHVAPKPPEKKKHDGFWATVGHALGDGWHAFYLTIRGVLVVVSAVLPFLVVLLAGLIAYRLARRRWPRATPPTMAPPPWAPTPRTPVGHPVSHAAPDDDQDLPTS
jgi:hypothetical protein